MSNPERPAAASPPWWALVPPAQTGVSCGGHTHQLRWSEGTLIALDHPDAEGERVLAALGGDRCECIDVVESWGAHCSVPGSCRTEPHNRAPAPSFPEATSPAPDLLM
jgi:hypothetical protein